MLNLENILIEYPKWQQSFKKNLLREYLQCKILDLIYKSQYGNKLSFLGGTSLKIVYGSNRFSEDLDFNNFKLMKNEFDDLILFVKNNLEKEGFLVEVKNVYKGAYRSYLKFREILYEQNLSKNKDEKILIQIDTVPHYFEYKPFDFLLQKFDVFRKIKVTPKDIILSQKILTVLKRKRTKGRDFFDIVFLWGNTRPNYKYLNEKINITNQKELKDLLFKKCKILNFKSLAKDVEPFLLKPDDKDRVFYFLEFVQQKM